MTTRSKGIKSKKKAFFFNSLLLVAGILVLNSISLSAASDRFILWLEIKGTINPAVSQYISKGLEKASVDKAACAIIQMDTPGGLDTPTEVRFVGYIFSGIEKKIYLIKSQLGKPWVKENPSGCHAQSEFTRMGVSWRSHVNEHFHVACRMKKVRVAGHA